MPIACTKPSVGDCYVIGGITKQSPTEGLVQANVPNVLPIKLVSPKKQYHMCIASHKTP